MYIYTIYTHTFHDLRRGFEHRVWRCRFRPQNKITVVAYCSVLLGVPMFHTSDIDSEHKLESRSLYSITTHYQTSPIIYKKSLIIYAKNPYANMPSNIRSKSRVSTKLKKLLSPDPKIKPITTVSRDLNRLFLLLQIPLFSYLNRQSFSLN